jgi:hypothetical protein
MPNYRYRFDLLTQAAIDARVPGPIVLGGSGPDIFKDVDVQIASKEDLDAYMASIGFSFFGTDQQPFTTSPANVYVDFTSGDDSASGITAGTPLRTLRQIAKRWPYLTQSMTINQVGVAANPAATDPFCWTPMVLGWDGTGSIPEVTFIGIETLSTLSAGGQNGIVNVATAEAGNVAPSLTDTAGAGVTWVEGTIIVTVAPTAGVWAAVLKDLGGGVAEVSPWRNAAGTGAGTAPPNATTYMAATYTQLPDVFVGGPCRFVFQKVQFEKMSCLNDTTSFGKVTACNMSLIRCVHPYWGSTPAGARVQIRGSYGRRSTTWNTSGSLIVSVGSGLVSFFGCGLNRAGCTLGIRVGGCANISFASCVIEHRNTPGIAVSGLPIQFEFPRSAMILIACGIFGVDNAAPALLVDQGGAVSVQGTLYGANNAGQGTKVIRGGLISVIAANTPTLAATGQELVLGNDYVNALPSLRGSAGAALPALAALTNWAQWAAAPFTRRVMDYDDGSAITTT